MGQKVSCGTKSHRAPKFEQHLVFTAAEVNAMRDTIAQSDDRYTITRETLVRKFKIDHDKANQIMKGFNAQELGYIDSQEFLCCVIFVSTAPFNWKARSLFELYDADKSTTLSLDEVTVMMSNAMNVLMYIEGKPTQPISVIAENVKSFFKANDTDGDNKINFTEFKTYLKTDKRILAAITSSGVIATDEIGIDFGSHTNEVPAFDQDLEEECRPVRLQVDQAKVMKKIQIEQIELAQDEFAEEDLGSGDQFMATRQSYPAPDSYKKAKQIIQPEQNLELEYVHGYRCHDVRNNLRYTANGQIVYHSAGVGIVLDQASNMQQFFRSHRDDIHCLAISPDQTICATGEIGPKPRLCLWSCEDMSELASVQIPLTKGIKHIAFSRDGQLIAASDMSDDHSIAIWSVKPNHQGLTLIAKGKGVRENIMSLGFVPGEGNDTLVATCVKSVAFFTWANGVIKCSKGTGWGAQGADTVLSQAFIGAVLYTGHNSGEIISWAGNGLSKRMQAHKEKVSCMYETKDGMISGSSDGSVSFWSKQSGQLVKTREVDLKKVASITHQATSVCEMNGRLLVGTRGGEIVEFDQAGNAVVRVRSHCNNELWGLSLHPRQKTFVTWDRAAVLCSWDIESRRQLVNMTLESGGDSICYSNDGKLLAVGFLNGDLSVLDEKFTQVARRRDRKGKAIQVIKFSPNDEICVTGGHDQFILTYNVPANFKPLHKIKGHSSTVKFIDFTLDSSAFQSLCQAYETLYFSCETGKQITRGASQFKNETWQTWSCPLGWPVQGIWPPCTDGSDINAVDRYFDMSIIATADDFGTVKLYNYPAASPKEEPHNTYHGHSSHVTNVQFTKFKQGQQYLLSTGGEDKSIFQWKYHVKQQANVLSTSKPIHNPIKRMQTVEDSQAPLMNDEFGEEDLGEGDQALAVKPWLGATKAMTPKDFKPPDAKKGVVATMELKWAHGFRSFDTKNNLRFNNEGNIIFTTAGVGVVQDLTQNTQEFFNQHHEDIVAMAYHAGRNIVATGQMAGKELTENTVVRQTLAQAKGVERGKDGKSTTQGKLVNIFLWDATTCKQIGPPINKLHRRAVRQLAFSNDGKYLLSIGEDDNHTMGIYDVESRKLLGDAKVDLDKVLDAQWNQGGTEVGTCSVKQVARFSFSPGQEPALKKSLCPTSMIPGNQVSVAVNYVLDNKLVTGTNQGKLITWNGTQFSKVIEAHKSSVYCIKALDSQSFFTSGADGCILKWNSAFTKQVYIDLTQMQVHQCGVTAFDFGKNKEILVGTDGAQILLVTSMVTPPKVINQGHYQLKGLQTHPEIWACTAHPTQQLFATGGGDCMVRVWSFKKMEKCSKPLAADPTSLDWSSDGKWLAVGDRKATITILNAQTLEIVDSLSSEVSKEKALQMKGKNNFKTEQWIEVCRFSPNNQMVAYGHHGYDTCLEVVSVNQEGKITTKPSIKNAKNTIPSAINHLDWSQDSQTIIITNTSYELRAFNVGGKVLEHVGRMSGLVDTQWQTWSCNLGFPVQGIYGKCADLTEINAVERSRNGQVIATATDSGEVKLFNWPCVNPDAKFDTYYGHSSHVTKVKFSAEDDLLISTGGGDMTVFVWDTDIKLLNKVEVYQPHPDDIELETKVDRSRILKNLLKQKITEDEVKAARDKYIEHGQPQNEFAEQDLGAGDEFLAVKPWKGQMKPPSNFKRASKESVMAPEVTIELDWVHGYRGSNSRNNLNYMQDGRLVYYAAGVSVSYDPVKHEQTHFCGHKDDVTAIAFHPNNQQFATGELGKKPICFIIDSKTMGVVKQLTGHGITESILCVGYSPSGKSLGIVSGNTDHCIAIYDTATWACIASGKGDRSYIVDFEFQDDSNFVTTGPKHYKYYTINGNTFKGALGNFNGNDQRISTCAFNNKDCLTGNINGDLYKWNATNMSVVMPKLHSRSIDAFTVTDNHIFTGGRDCKIQVISKTYKLLFTIDTEQIKNSVNQQIRAITLNDSFTKVSVGTYGHEVVEMDIDLQNNTHGQGKVLVHGHYAPTSFIPNEVWGLCVFPKTMGRYATVSDDGTLRVWDQQTRKQVAIVSLEVDLNGQQIPKLPDTGLSLSSMARAIAINLSEEYIAVGMRDGAVRVYQNLGVTLKMISSYTCDHKKQKILAEWIEDLKFSPDDKYLLVTSHNNRMFLFEVPNFEKPVKVFGASSSFITHVDWSLDSQSIRTNDGSYELLYYSIPDGQQIKGGASQFRDEQWASNSCVLGWAVQGIWQKGMDGSDINHADRSHGPVNGQQLIATADDNGYVNVYKYPSPLDTPAAKVSGVGHCSHVTKVMFSMDDSYLYSVGGNDTTVMQWKVICNE